MTNQEQNPTQRPDQQQSRQRQQERNPGQQDQDLSQGSETPDDGLQEDHRDYSDTGRGKRGVLDK